MEAGGGQGPDERIEMEEEEAEEEGKKEAEDSTMGRRQRRATPHGRMAGHATGSGTV